MGLRWRLEVDAEDMGVAGRVLATVAVTCCHCPGKWRWLGMWGPDDTTLPLRCVRGLWASAWSTTTCGRSQSATTTSPSRHGWDGGSMARREPRTCSELPAGPGGRGAPGVPGSTSYLRRLSPCSLPCCPLFSVTQTRTQTAVTLMASPVLAPHHPCPLPLTA